MSTPEPKFYVSPPVLPAAQKRNYVPAKDVLSLKEDARVDEVIGEYFDEERGHFYFARYAGGIAHKFHAAEFERKYDALVKAFRAKKRSNTLPKFDPNATYVHPLSRPKARNGKQGNPSLRISQSTEVESVAASEEEESTEYEDEGEEEDEDEGEEEGEDEGEEDHEYEEDEEDSARTPPRSVRPTTRKELPYSPKKTRSTHIAVIESDSEASWKGSADHQSLRRSTRSRKAAEIVLVSDEDSDEGYTSRPKKGKAQPVRKKRTVKSVQPMYGRFRDISTLDEDPFSDEDDEVLRLHRKVCEKCYQPPAHTLLEQFRKKSKRKGKKRKRSTDDEFEESTDEESFTSIGGWVQCLKCPVSAHWKCIAPTQRDEVLRAARERDRQALQTSSDPDSLQQVEVRRRELEYTQVTEFLCGACSRGGICIGCSEDVSLQVGDSTQVHDGATNDADDATTEAMPVDPPQTTHILARELLFRCLTCKRPSHYRHLPMPEAGEGEKYDLDDIALHYQKRWLCADCLSYTYGLDKIIAWRPYPLTAVEKYAEGDRPNYKAALPREYLVKWENRSYRRLDWVPHMWLLSTSGSKLKNFISGGTKVELSTRADDDDAEPEPNFLRDKPEVETNGLRSPSIQDVVSPFDSLPDAERRIPRSWKTIDRILDVVMWIPDKYFSSTKGRIRRDETVSANEEKRHAMTLASEKGEEPSKSFTWTAEQWQDEEGTLTQKNGAMVAWAFIKWEGLGYDECSWDAPPQSGEPGHKEYKRAFDRYIAAQKVFIMKQPKKYWDVFDERNKDEYRKRHILEKAEDLVLGQPPNLKLMPFQVDGFNWLCNNWWNHQHCILADEMGLGKTVQIVTFLGNIISHWHALPALVVVPNSTITNWVREFERWAPNLRVVPFNGEKAAREVIKDFELFHKTVTSDKTKAKFHVLITTYETLTGAKDFTAVFKNQPRWEVLVVDEGQRLKSDSGLLFRKLNELNSAHRIIMTGTPLNNNIRELFNLMNFLDPNEWSDLAALEKEHETLSEELVKQLHTRLRPYFLRRIKSEVLDLPPKNEVIIPVSMAPLQREVYKSILTHNLNILNGLTQPGVGASAPTKSRINNVLMQLRKCLQHPYLYAEDIEPRNLGPAETHAKLIDGSAKLRFLKALLPKLKERGNRVLLFSQFVIALNIVEDFLNGEGYKFLRLDGNTKGNLRQKMMDEYNKPGSEYFIFLLTTRAGGVGINLFSADTVIIFDPDFNPHQDLQAIARAYRYGQEKTCLVFKLMVKESAEERIMQIGKKKLVLDHLIVQKMDDNDENGGEDVQSILTYGAQSLFQSNEGSREIHYSDQDIVKLLEKTEKEAVKEAPKAGAGLAFSFAKIWAADKDSLDEVVEEDRRDSWAQTLAKINEETAKQQAIKAAQTGRGSRRKAADIAKSKINGAAQVTDTPKSKFKTMQKAVDSDDFAYSGSDHDGSSIENDGDHAKVDGDFVVRNGDSKKHKGSKSQRKLSGVTHDYSYNPCGLCGQGHGSGDCKLVENSAKLAEFREMLILNADDEPWEDRQSAIVAIDEMLHARGDLALIAGQPLHPLPKSMVPPSLPSSTILPSRGVNNAPFGGSANMVRNSVPHATNPQGFASVPVPKKRNQNVALLSRNAAATGVSLPKQEEPLKKKLKTPASTDKCPLCGSNPGHILEKCSVVLAGPTSILDQMVMLHGKADPDSINMLQRLRPLLEQSKASTSLTAS